MGDSYGLLNVRDGESIKAEVVRHHVLTDIDGNPQNIANGRHAGDPAGIHRPLHMR